MTNNYFKSRFGVFMFDNHDLDSIQNAWLAAHAHGEAKGDVEVCAFAAVPMTGPWHGCDLVGIQKQAPIKRKITLAGGKSIGVITDAEAGAMAAHTDAWNAAMREAERRLARAAADAWNAAMREAKRRLARAAA